MKIFYVANHDCGDNDDEGAIAHALRVLGHEVTCFHERPKHRPDPVADVRRFAEGHDLCLYHKWPNADEVRRTAQVVPCALWYFDKVQSGGDPTLETRSRSRVDWFRSVVPHTAFAFCTDGDWAARQTLTQFFYASDRPCRFVHLPQGMDERAAGFGTAAGPGPDVLFTGMIHHGRARAEQVARLRDRYGDRFAVVGDSGPRGRVHGRALADLFASARVVVAPVGPGTDRYWSNRVYLTTGLGGFLLHPWSEGLAKEYRPDLDLLYYADTDKLFSLIDTFTTDTPTVRGAVAARREAGYRRTMERFTYRHRCEQLLNTVTGKTDA